MFVVARVAIGFRAGYRHVKHNAVEQNYITESTLLKKRRETRRS